MINMFKGRLRRDKSQCKQLFQRLKESAGVYNYRSIQWVDESVYRGEMAGLKVKSHLESLMGTDIVKLNDREYMLSLQKRLMNEYESTMNKEEEQRSEIERRRQRRLYIEGLQDLPNIDSKSAKSKSAAMKLSVSRPNTDRKSTGSHVGTEEDGFINPTIGLSVNPSRHTDRHTRSQSKRKPSSKLIEEKACAITLAGGSMTTEESKHIEEKYPSVQEEMNTQRALLMRQLRKESSVNGLYRTADLVLSAPVAEFVADTNTVAGSAFGSTPSKEDLDEALK